MELEINNKTTKFGISILICLIILAFSLTPYNISEAKSSSYQIAASPPSIDINQINFSRIQSDVSFFSSVGTRVTGYSGCEKAADYITKSFSDIGLEIQVHEYYTPIPIDSDSWITVEQGPYAGSNYTAYALWPNAGVSSASGDFSGRLFYVGQGTLEELNGLDIQDSIILSDFNSGKNWLDAAKLGAKGAIFIEPFYTIKYEALDKGTLAPLDFARLYVDRVTGEKLKEIAENNGTVAMHVNMKWENKEAKNIIGILEGDNPNDVLILSAHYDSWSIAPGISPASEDSIGISTLLELARFFKDNKPKQTIWFVAYSGHWEGGIGAVEFIEDILLNTTKRIWLQVGIDISSESPGIDCLYLSSFYGSMQPATGWGTMSWVTVYALTSAWAIRYSWIESLSSSFLSIPVENIGGQVYMPPEARILGDLVKYGLRVDSRFGSQTDFYMLDTEPSSSITAMAVTLKTQYARRMSWLSPVDNPIAWRYVWPQVITIQTIINGFANVDMNRNPPYDYNIASPKRWYILGGAVGIAGFTTLDGKTVEFSNLTGWYEPLPHSLVRLHVYDPQASNAWPFSYRYTFSDENGQFIFHGLIPYISWQIDAWKFNQKTGEIEYAVDWGYYGLAQGVAGGLRAQVYPLTTNVSALVPLFKCKHITLFDMIDTRTMRSLIIRDYRNPNHNYFNGYTTSFGLFGQPSFVAVGGRGGAVFGFGLGVYTAKAKSAPVFMGIYAGADGITDIYVKEGEKLIITFNPDPARVSWPMMVLSNSSFDCPEGNGYTISDNVIVSLTAYRSMIDMHRMISHRYAGFTHFGVRVTYAEQMLEKANLYVEKANNSYHRKDYDDMYYKSYLALQYLSNAYSQSVMPLYSEASNSITFFSLLILPFAILFERTIFQWVSYRRFVGIFCLMALFFILYSLVHPAFSVMSNAFMTVISVGVLLLLITIVAIFITEMRDLLGTVRVSMLGEHIFRTDRVSALMHTLTSSVENIRKRPLLTTLALVSIICFTAAMTAFTSTSYGFSTIKSASPYAPPYTGILIKNIYGIPPESMGGPLDLATLRYVQSLAGEDYEASPRVWMYPQPQSPETLPVAELINANGTKQRLLCVFMGLSSTEMQFILEGHLLGLDSFTGKYQCVLPSDSAKSLGVDVGDSLIIRGLDANFTVIGITDLVEQIRDFDGKFVLPIDAGYSADLSLQSAAIYPASMVPSPVPTTQVVYVPWEIALEHGGFISSIALIPKVEKTSEEMEELASTITSCTSLMTHVGVKDRAFGLQTIFTYFLQGWNITVMILMALVVLSVANVMLGTLVSRKRDIHVYSTLGLSPGGVMIIFLTEGITLGFGGILIGYLVGFALNQMFLGMNVLPASFAFNFVSLPVIISMGLIIGTVLIASLYPATLAARLVTPSLERRWKAGTRPVGDLWELSMPLKASRFESLGVLRYMKEYFTGAGSAKAGFTVLAVSEVNVENVELAFDVILTPVEQNLVQTAVIKGKEEKGEYEFTLILKRKTGDPKLWQSRSRALIDDVRKQCLVWKGLSPEARRKYIL